MLILVPLNGLVINSLGFLSQHFRLNRGVIVAVIIGFLVSLPEIFISINAGILGQPELALGNALGSAVVLLTLVAGVIAVYNKNLRTTKLFSKTLTVYLSLAACLNIILSYDGRISRTDGIILIFTYIIYLLLLTAEKNGFRINELKIDKKKVTLNIFFAVIGIIALFILSYFVNTAAFNLYVNSGLSLFALGFLIIAPFGALPELFFELELNRRSQSELSLAELFTSIIASLTLGIGIAAVISPINITNSLIYYFVAFAFVVVLLIFNFLARSARKLDWKEGIILIAVFLLVFLSTISLII
jgi:cation:H+ antiporter